MSASNLCNILLITFLRLLHSQEKPDPNFKRESDDLVYTLSIPLKEALGGVTGSTQREIKHLDDRIIKFNVPFPPATGGAPLKPGQIIRINGEVSLDFFRGFSIFVLLIRLLF